MGSRESNRSRDCVLCASVPTSHPVSLLIAYSQQIPPGATSERCWRQGGAMAARWRCDAGAMPAPHLITDVKGAAGDAVWSRRDQINPNERVSTSEACEGQTRGETQWRPGLLPPPAAATPQSQVIRRDFDQWNARFKFSRPSSEAGNMVFRPSVVIWSHWIKILIQNPMFISKYRVMQRASRGHPALFSHNYLWLCLGTQGWSHWFTAVEFKCIITTNFTVVC